MKLATMSANNTVMGLIIGFVVFRGHIFLHFFLNRGLSLSLFHSKLKLKRNPLFLRYFKSKTKEDVMRIVAAFGSVEEGELSAVSLPEPILQLRTESNFKSSAGFSLQTIV